MKAKVKYFICSVIVAVILTAFSAKAGATNLRGRLVHYDSGSGLYYPVSNTRVDIWVYNGAQWVDAAYAVSGGDGMYYFMNMAPGVNFQIQVNGNFYPPQPLFLANVPLQDIPQIFL